MEKPDAAALIGTGVLAASAGVTLGQVAVMLVGALGGAFWSMMQGPRMAVPDALWHMAPRAVFSGCLCWMPAYWTQGYATAHGVEAPLGLVLLAVAFVFASLKESVAVVKEYAPALGRLGRREP